MIEYNSLQSLLGISPTNHKGSSGGGSPNKDDKNTINLFPVPKHKFHNEETKSREHETRKEEDVVKEKRHDSVNLVKLPDIQVHTTEIPSRNSTPFSINISYTSKHNKSSSNITRNMNNQTVNRIITNLMLLASC